MAFYLTKERHEDVSGSYRRYREYLQANEHRFPKGAFAFATSGWWYDGNDHRSLHDAWLESMTLSEPATGERFEQRFTTLRVRLLGAYHDGFIELFYPRVFNYSFQSPDSARGIRDWVYDEFRLSEDGHLIHEIEWSSGSRWTIEATDIEYQWIPK